MISDFDFVLPYLAPTPAALYSQSGITMGCGEHIRIIAPACRRLATASEQARNSPSSLWEVVRKYHCDLDRPCARPATADFDKLR